MKFILKFSLTLLYQVSFTFGLIGWQNNNNNPQFNGWHIIIILICQKLGLARPVKQKRKLPSLYSKFVFFDTIDLTSRRLRWTSSFNTWHIYNIFRIQIFLQNPTVTFAHLMPLVRYNFRKTLGIIRIYLNC